MTTVMIGREATARRSPTPVVKPMRADDGDCLVEMLGRCSRSSLYHRFHGFVDGTAYVRNRLRTGADIVRVAWSETACIGFGVLAANRGRPWDLGILVEDSWQRRGVGTFLLASLISEARLLRMPVVEATILGEDAFIVGLLRRVGSVRREFDWGALTLEVTLEDTPQEAGRS